MECKKCHAELENGVKVCPSCGEKVDAQEAPENDKVHTAQKEETEVAVDEVSAGTAEAEDAKKNVKRRLVIGGSAAAAAVIVIAASVAMMKLGGGGKSDLQGIMYVKDEGIYGMNLQQKDASAVEYTDRFLDSSDGTQLGATRLNMTTVSKDGKYHFFPQKYDRQSGTYTLFYKQGEQEAEKIASGVASYDVTSDNQVVYKKDDGLYLSTLNKNADNKIASDVTDYALYQDGKILIYTKDAEEGNSDYYKIDLSVADAKEEKLISDASFVYQSEEPSMFLFLKGEDLYQSKDYGVAEKLIENVNDVLSVDASKGSFFYTSNKEIKGMASDYLEDDLAESDAQVQEPNKADYQVEKRSRWSYYYSYTYTTTSDQYYEDLEKYEQKVERDKLREELKNQEVTETYKELYYFADGNSTLITSDCLNTMDVVDPSKKDGNQAFTSALLYKRSDAEAEKSNIKVKISEIDGADDIQNRLNQEHGKVEGAYYLYSNGAEKALDLDDQKFETVRADAKNNQLYMLLFDEKDDEDVTAGDLVTVGLADETAELKSYDEDVERLALVSGGEVYYFKDIDTEKAEGDLYRSQERICYDVKTTNSVWALPNSTAVICAVDYDGDKQTATLNLLSKGAEDITIAEDVYMGGGRPFYAEAQNSIYMLGDYRNNRGGDLLYYDGKETESIDNDVTAYFADSEYDTEVLGNTSWYITLGSKSGSSIALAGESESSKAKKYKAYIRKQGYGYLIDEYDAEKEAGELTEEDYMADLKAWAEALGYSDNAAATPTAAAAGV